MPVPSYDGLMLPARTLCAERGSGMRVARTVEIKRVDTAYFEDAGPE